MSEPIDIPLCPSAHAAIRRIYRAAGDRSPGLGGDDDPGRPLCCSIRALLRCRLPYSFNETAWAARFDLAFILGDPAFRRAYADRAILETQVFWSSGKDLTWGLVFYRRRGRQLARRYVVPADPLTPARQRARENMRTVSKTASALTLEQRLAWTAAGAKELSRRRITQGPLAWQALFVKRNAVLAQVGRELLLWPPAPAKFGPNPVAGLVPGYEDGQFRLILQLSRPVVEDLMVYGEGPVSPKRQKLRHPVYLGVLRGRAAGRSDITAWYVARFGEPPPERKVLIGVQPQVNGEKGRMKVLGAVVTARMGEGRRQNAEGRRGAVNRLGLGVGRAGEWDSGRRVELNELMGWPGLDGLPRFRPGWGEAGGSREPREGGWGSWRKVGQSEGGWPCTREGMPTATGCPRWRPNAEGRRQKAEGRKGAGERGVPKNRRKCHRRELWRGS